MRVGQGCLVGGGLRRSSVTLRFGGTARDALCYDRRNLQGFFLQSISPPWHHEDSGYSSESQETQFLVFLLLRTVNGTKQKQTGAGVAPHKRQREGKE